MSVFLLPASQKSASIKDGGKGGVKGEERDVKIKTYYVPVPLPHDKGNTHVL